jgi:hypothetical protein
MASYPLPGHFSVLFKRLNPGLSFESTASTQYNTIKGLIEDRSGPAAVLEPICFLQGSYKQQTAIYSINDVDIVALCKLWFPGSGVGRGYNRDEIFKVIASPLMADGRYRAKVRYGPGSMCIKVDLGIKVEILPVTFRAGNYDPSDEPFKLFRPASASWEDGFARYHQAYLTYKNRPDRTAGNFIPAIKVLKHLRSLCGIQAVSFHIECLLYSLPDSVFLGAPADYIPAFLYEIAKTSADAWYAKAVLTPCSDRDIFVGAEWMLADWRLFHNALVTWSSLAGFAKHASSQAEAIRLWKVLFGEKYFPETIS